MSRISYYLSIHRIPSCVILLPLRMGIGVCVRLEISTFAIAAIVKGTKYKAHASEHAREKTSIEHNVMIDVYRFTSMYL